MSGAMPLVETKLHAPRRRRGLVDRERLDQRLGGVDLPAVALVSAPAGFGKTTLLAEWVLRSGARGLRTAWLSLDRHDSEPTVFWSYVIAALRKQAPGVGAEALATLQSSPAALAGVAAALVNDLAELPFEVALVLDDYHAIESIEIHESVLFLVEHLPDRAHLLIGSRSDPPWPLGGLRARGDLVEVRAADLRFRTEETTRYLNQEMGLDLSVADIDALDARTEGWIAALQLAALSLQGHDDASGFIAGFAGDDRFVVDYLVDEVLDRQPGEIRSFLLDTSILSRFSASLCSAVTGRTDAKETLAALDRSNLFLVALDDRREWYRYHHLFSEVLRARLADGAADHVTVLHRQASGWWEANGDRAEAVRHSLAAEDVERAAELIELSVPDLRQNRQDSTLRAWMDALPDSVFADRPVLNLGRVGAHMVTSETGGVAEMLDQIEAWLGTDASAGDMVVHDLVEFHRLPAQTAMYRAGLALLTGDLAGTEVHAARAGDLSAPDDHLGRGAAAALMGLARWASGDLRSAAAHYHASVVEFSTADLVPSTLGCSLSLADLQVGLGLLGAAEATLRSGVGLTTKHGPQRGSADMHIGLAEVHLERDELSDAAEQLRLGLELGERFALPQYAHRRRVVDARLRAIRGDFEDALPLLREAERLYETDYSPKVRPVGATIARVHLAAGHLGAAEVWAATAGLSADDEPVYVREYEHLTYARFLLAAGRAGEAVGLLGRLEAAAERGGRRGSVIEAQILLALAHDAGGDRAHALDLVAGAVAGAVAERHAGIFRDAGQPVAALVTAAEQAGRLPGPAASLVTANTAPKSPAVQRLVDPLSRRELDVLRLLRSDLTGPEIAAELYVSLNTVRTHTKSIFTKLEVKNRRAAVRRADELGL